MSKITDSESFEAKISETGKTILADFYSDSCMPCRRMAPVIEELAEELSDKLDVIKINISGGAELAAKYGVSAVPTMIFFRKGKEIHRIVGALGKGDMLGEMSRMGI